MTSKDLVNSQDTSTMLHCVNLKTPGKSQVSKHLTFPYPLAPISSHSLLLFLHFIELDVQDFQITHWTWPINPPNLAMHNKEPN
jgi:hypothetical protein